MSTLAYNSVLYSQSLRYYGPLSWLPPQEIGYIYMDLIDGYVPEPCELVSYLFGTRRLHVERAHFDFRFTIFATFFVRQYSLGSEPTGIIYVILRLYVYWGKISIPIDLSKIRTIVLVGEIGNISECPRPA